MKKSRRSFASLLLACGLLAGAGGIAAYASDTRHAKTTDTTQTKEEHHKDEKHPQIHKALRGLRMAKEHLSDAAHDFGGHRAAALKATEEAIKECEECLKLDK